MARVAPTGEGPGLGPTGEGSWLQTRVYEGRSGLCGRGPRRVTSPDEGGPVHHRQLGLDPLLPWDHMS